MSFSVFTRKVKEKVGLAERSEENAAIVDETKKVMVMNSNLKRLIKSLEKSTNAVTGVVENGTALSDGLIDFHVAFKDDSDRYLMSGSLERVGEFQRKLEDVRKKLAEKIATDVTDPLKSVLDTDMRDAFNQKAVYDSVRVDMANANDKLAAAKKSKKDAAIQQAEQLVDAKKRQLELVDKETLFKLRDSVDVAELQALERVCTYIEEHRLFFQRASQFLNEMMTDVFDYRRYVEEKRAQFKEKAKQRTTTVVSQRQSYLEKRQSVFVQPNKFYGVHLAELCQREGRPIPRVFETLCNTIEARFLDEEGIFRLAGSKTAVNALKQQIDAGTADLTSPLDPHSYVDLLKIWLREMPEPLLTHALYNSIMAVRTVDTEQRPAYLGRTLRRLPAPNWTVLQRLMALLHATTGHSKSNKMSPVTLSTCIAPNILMTPELTGDIFEQTAQQNAVVSFMIQHYEEIFESEPVEAEQPQSPLPPPPSRPATMSVTPM